MLVNEAVWFRRRSAHTGIDLRDNQAHGSAVECGAIQLRAVIWRSLIGHLADNSRQQAILLEARPPQIEGDPAVGGAGGPQQL